MSHTAVVRAGQNNTVTVKPNSPSVVKVKQADQNKVSVSAGFDITVTNIDGSFTETITDVIQVTNNDVAIGDARGRQYVAGTTVEEILRDILDPLVDPLLTLSLNIDTGTLAGIEDVDLDSKYDIEWGYIPVINSHSLTISDPDELTSSDSTLALISNAYSPNVPYTVSDVGVANWHDIHGIETPLTVGSPDMSSYLDTGGYRFTYSFKLQLPYERRGTQNTSESNTVQINMVKNSFLFGSTVDIRGGVGVANTLNNMMNVPNAKTTKKTSSVISFTAREPLDNPAYYTYIAIPNDVSIDLSSPDSIQSGAFNISELFTEVQNDLRYDVAEIVGGLLSNYRYRVYQSIQPQAFQGGETVKVTLDL